MKVIGLLLLAVGSLWAQTDRPHPGEGFDKPLKRTVVDLGPSRYYSPSQRVRNKLTCYYYSTFTVKQYDEGQKGAEWLSVVRSAQAPCTRTHRKDEKVYRYPEWVGYFWAAKGDVVFFDADDGIDGGMPFAIFDVRTGRKLFEDSSPLDYYQEHLHIKDAFRITRGADQVLRLTYFRVVEAGCDLRTEQAGCWRTVKAKFGIKQTETPVCSGYEQIREDNPSAAAYPVSVLLTDAPQINAIDGPVFCWPAD